MHYLPRLLELMKRGDYIPLPEDRIAEELEIPETEREELHREIGQHLRQGTLVKLKKNRLCLPRDADLITGTIRFRQGGSAFMFAETGDTQQPPTAYQIRAEDTAVAMHGDRVVCRINQDPQANRRRHKGGKFNNRADEPTARVIRILERANEVLTGTLRRSKHFHYVVPGDPRIQQDILVPDPADSTLSFQPRIDDKVVVRLAPWEQRHLNPEGEIIEVLGRTFEPGAEYRALLRQYKLNPEFPPEVTAEVAAIPAKVERSEIAYRRDIRKVFTFTIDPQDAKDFDDALSLERLDDGNLRIGIHIADVSAYVKPGTALDREAFNRGNSTYLVGTVIPMLPHALSNGICSLVEDEDRLTKSVFLVVTPNAKIVGTEFANTVIRSNKRLAYEQAYALLKEDALEKIRELPEPPKHQTAATGRALRSLTDQELSQLQTDIRTFWSIASKFRARRMRAGSLDLDMPETKIFVDPQGYAERLVKIEHDESHQLIEEFMLAANEAVATTLNRRRLPAIHRVHDKPDPSKLDDLAEYMETAGLKPGNLAEKKNVSALLRNIKTHPQTHTLRVMVLRSLKQAQYRASPDGHYGLGKQNYLHFTSPIRRYADLVVHRIMDRYLVPEDQKPPEDRLQDYDMGRLSAVAQHLSITEQNSTEAERESNKIKILEYFERELAKQPRNEFEAVIMDVRNHGMFIELTQSLAYGLVHVSTLHDDLYSINSDGNALIGRKTKRRFALGDKVMVSVYRVDRFKRQIDFQVARSGPEKPGTSGQKASGPRSEVLPSGGSSKKRRPRGSSKPTDKDAGKSRKSGGSRRRS